MNKKGKGYKTNGRNRGKPDRKERLEESLDMTRNGKITPDQRRLARDYDNNPEWYAQNPQLLKDYASYPFGIPLGAPISQQNSAYKNAIPGVAIFEFVPSVGVAKLETDPINVAMRKLYSFVRHANSGAKNYDAPDLMMYVVAVDSCRMYLEWMKRAYGVIMNYTAFNRYYPRALIDGMHLDFTDLQANLNDFRGYINQFAVKLNQLWVPAGFSYFKRHEWLCQHIYVDSKDSAKAQTYLFTPVGFYKFSVSGNPAVGKLEQMNIYNRLGLSDLITKGDTLLNALITNEDIGIMAGDILKAYGTSGVLTTYGIDENFRVLPEYSEEVMSQIENIMLAPAYGWGVTQNTAIGGGFLQSKPGGTVNATLTGTPTPGDPPAQYQTNFADALAAQLTKSKLLNLHNMENSPEAVIVATRGMFTIDADSVIYSTAGSPGAMFSFSSCGSEIFTNMVVKTSVQPGTGYDYASVNWYYVTSAVGNVIAGAQLLITGYEQVSQFDWHPDIQMGLVVSESPDFQWTTPSYPFLDVDNYTFVDPANISNMHAIALLSEFTVPMVG